MIDPEIQAELANYVSKRILLNTCICTAAIAVLLAWGLSRFDVWNIESAIDRLSRHVDMNNSNTVNFNDPEALLKDRRLRDIHRAKGTFPNPETSLEESDADVRRDENAVPGPLRPED